MSTTKLVLIGLAIFVFSQLRGAGHAASVGASVTGQAGTIVTPPKEVWSQMDKGSKLGYAMGSAWQDLGTQDDVQTCSQAIDGSRYAPDTQAFGYAGAGYNAIRDGIFGLDC